MTVSLGTQFIPVDNGIGVHSNFLYVIFNLIQHISK